MRTSVLVRIGVSAAVLLLLCSCSPTARGKLLETLSTSHSRTIEFLGDLVEQEGDAQSLETISRAAPPRIDTWDADGPDAERDMSYAVVLIYGADHDSDGLSVTARLLGRSYVGGGWLADSEDGYLCITYTVRQDEPRGQAVVDSTQVACLEELVPPSTYAIEVWLGDLRVRE